MYNNVCERVQDNSTHVYTSLSQENGDPIIPYLEEWGKSTVETHSEVHWLCPHISENAGIEARDGLLLEVR